MQGIQLYKQVWNINKFLLIRFRYKWKATVAGTSWYHSHTNLQRAQGLFGANIVRQDPDEDPNSSLYNYDLTEHSMFIQEWFHKVNFFSIV